jgi:hypothetical protein
MHWKTSTVTFFEKAEPSNVPGSAGAWFQEKRTCRQRFWSLLAARTVLDVRYLG